MKILNTVFLILLLLFSVYSCSTAAKSVTTTPRILRQAVHTPELFLPEKGKLDTKSCKNPMIDPRDNSKIFLVSSTTGRGNYKVASGKYGIVKGELLRLDCTNGKALGIIKE